MMPVKMQMNFKILLGVCKDDTVQGRLPDLASRNTTRSVNFEFQISEE